MKKVASFTFLSAIRLLTTVVYQEKEFLIVGTDSPFTINLLDSSLSIISKRNIEAFPTAATAIDKYLIVANKNTIDFFICKKFESSCELEKVHYVKGYYLTTSLYTNGNFLLVSDAYQSVTIYIVYNDKVEEVYRDGYMRGISSMCVLNNYVFVSDYSSTIGCYLMQTDVWNMLESLTQILFY